MFLVYGFTAIIAGAWLLKTINDKKLTFKQTPLDIPLLLFLGANILSTIFSIDLHTSIWGYYSRLNGGLLSLIAYLLLYWAFVSHMDLEKVKTTLKFSLVSALLISLWAIFEHFGISPSCIILRGQFNTSCWIQDVQARVFATLGQPNWLAAYLAMLIFPALYFLFTSTNKVEKIIYYLSLFVMYLAFTFTYSRGPTLGLIGGLLMLILFAWKKAYRKLSIIVISFLFINLLFGSALTSFRLVSKFAAPVRPSIAVPTVAAPTTGTQLENGGTESGQIRLIVWKGALEIFKNYPIFGSGLETFAQVYYQYRPQQHNLTSEWDFLYNKAHNEYLNYLSTTGLIGLGSYLIMILVFIKFVLFQKKSKDLLIYCLLAAYLSYLIYNFFLFSVVIIAVFFYLFPAMVFIITDSLKSKNLLSVSHFIYQRPIYTKITKGIIIFSTIYLLFSIFQLWYADTLFAKGEAASQLGNPGRAYNYLSIASELNKNEPFYRSELAFAAAQAAASLQNSDASLSAALKEEALANLKAVKKQSPKNVSLLKTAVRTYFELASVDKIYLDKTLETLNQGIKLAPTDPKLYYNKALVLELSGKKDEAIKTLQQAIKLKPNYQEALVQLEEITNP